MPPKRICLQCGKEFIPERIGNRPNGQIRYSERKYCSKECLQEHDRQVAMQKKNICQICGKEFDREKIGYGQYADRKICPECSSKGLSKKDSKKVSKCWYCKKELKPGQKYFCSDECKTEYYKIKDKRCINCGKLFDAKIIGYDKHGKPKYSSSTFCSDECSQDFSAKQQWGDMYIDKDHAKRKCKICGKEFVIERLPNGKDWSKKLYCSDACLQIAENQRYNKDFKIKICENPVCRKEFKVYRLPNGHDFENVKYCSDACYRACCSNNHKKAWNTLTNEDKQQIYDKRQQTCLDKYGVPYTCLTPECMSKNYKKNSLINQKFADSLKNIEGIGELVLDKVIIQNRCYDIYVKDSNTLIEINPTYSHTCIDGAVFEKKDRDYHKNKTELARKNGYKCINIWSWDDNLKILNMFINKQKLYAKKLLLKEIDKSIANDFLNLYHLQNSCYGNKVNLGLYLGDDIIQVMTFGKPRYNKNYQWELLRLCTKPCYYVVGGAERLFKYFVKNYNPESVISYCDVSKFEGKVYERLGFRLKEQTNPQKIWSKSTKYITDNLLRQRGADQLIGTHDGKGTDNEEIMIRECWLPVYDCGQKVFVWSC